MYKYYLNRPLSPPPLLLSKVVGNFFTPRHFYSQAPVGASPYAAESCKNASHDLLSSTQTHDRLELP